VERKLPVRHPGGSRRTRYTVKGFAAAPASGQIA
jgi:hypothetical protein